jgi:putative component of membrane protein insertase Oxa1/YidC/SpoIIIJ protein YidD
MVTWNKIRVLFPLWALLLTSVPCAAQTFEEDLARLMACSFLPNTIERSAADSGGTAETLDLPEHKLLFVGLIRLYQKTVSSQDMSVCNFWPSCSRFGETAVRRAGLFKGLLLTSDRLQRCNGMSFNSRVYRYDRTRGKLIDPVEEYLGLR